MAFENANARRPNLGRGGASGGAFDSASSSRPSASAGGYQSADTLYTSTCDNIDKELRKLNTYVTSAKKQTEAVGGARDSADMRTKLKAGLQKGAECVKSLGNMLKQELAPAVDSADLSARERTARKQQMQRYMGDYKAAVEAYEEANRAAVAAERRNPNPPKGAAAGGADGAADGAGGAGRRGARGAGGRGPMSEEASAAAREEDALLSRMQAVDFDSSLVEERENAIVNIASTIQEVNETMRDLAALVEEQGKDIEKIEDNVTQAEDRTSSGVKELEGASKYQKGYRKWILVFIVMIVLVAGGALAYVFIAKPKG